MALAPTAPPNKEFHASGNIYRHPISDEVFDAVTSALECFDKDGLVPWSGWLAADATISELPKIVAAWLTPDCGRTWNQCDHDWQQTCADCPCRQCRACIRRWLADRHIAEKTRRADEGSRVHSVADQWRQTGIWVPADADIQPYVDQLKKWTDDYGVRPEDWEASETTVLNREHMYAGTVDGLLRLHADRSQLAADMCARIGHTGGDPLTMVDLKTREKDNRFFVDYALQQSGYRNCVVVMLPDGTELPIPRFAECLILQVRPDGYEFRPVDTGQTTYEQFLRVLASHRWRRDNGTAVISSRGFPMPDEYKKERTKLRRRAAAAAKKAAAAETTAPPETALPEPEPAKTPPAPILPDMSRAQAAWDALAADHDKHPRKTAPAKKTAAKKTTPKKTATPGRTIEESVLGRRIPDDQLFPDSDLWKDEIPF